LCLHVLVLCIVSNVVRHLCLRIVQSGLPIRFSLKIEYIVNTHVHVSVCMYSICVLYPMLSDYPVCITLSVFANVYLYPVQYWYILVFSSVKDVTVWMKKKKMNWCLLLAKRVSHLVQETHLKYVERRGSRDVCHYTVSHIMHSTNYSRSSVYSIMFPLYVYWEGVLF
jgi:hypothetical protein